MASEDDHFHILQWHFIEINPSNFHLYTRGIFLVLFFFALLILIATLFLLAHFCRRRRLRASRARADHSSSGSGSDKEGVIRFGMESLALGNERRSAVVGGDSNINMECCICLSAFQEDEKVKVLPECEHAYHSECVERWLTSHPTCPLCRASLHKFICNAL